MYIQTTFHFLACFDKITISIIIDYIYKSQKDFVKFIEFVCNIKPNFAKVYNIPSLFTIISRINTTILRHITLLVYNSNLC